MAHFLAHMRVRGLSREGQVFVPQYLRPPLLTHTILTNIKFLVSGVLLVVLDSLEDIEVAQVEARALVTVIKLK